MPEDTSNTPETSGDQPLENIETDTTVTSPENDSRDVSPISQPETNTSPALPSSVLQPKPAPSKKRLIITIIAVVLLLLAGGAYIFMNRDKATDNDGTANQEQADQKPRLGVTPTVLEGLVEYSNDGTSWQALTEASQLNEGDYVRTNSEGRAVLALDDGSAVRLGKNSKLQLKDLTTDNVVITNETGEVYSRVVPSTSRKYTVRVNDTAYEAKGTAYRTTNTSTKQGLEVFHSTVAVTDKNTDVTEGNSFFTLTEQKEKENQVLALDVEALKNDEFIKWNAEKDKQEAEFADKLGVLTELDKPAPTPTPAPSPAPASSKGLTLAVSTKEYTANFSWKNVGIDAGKGYKLVKSKTSKTPTYPENSAAFIEAGKTSYSLYLGDGNTYYFRICAYRGDSCDSYSNVVTVTTAAKPKPEVTSGTITLSLNGTTASWSDTGKAGNGYKMVLSTTSAPTYPGAEIAKYVSETSKTLPDGLTSGSTNYIRICRYTNEGSCTDYSNELTYLAP